jgi:nitronate monooxygenase
VDLRRLRVPVVAAPMFLVSGPELVLAACAAGIVGAFPTPNCRAVAQLDEWMGTISDGLASARRSGVDAGPWAVNLITHSSNERLAEDLRLVAEYRPPLVITALGSPRPVVETVHAYGGTVIGDVVSVRLAHKAVEAGADGLACVSAGAGGHTGHLSPFAFVSAVREFFDGTVIVGGGVSDGWGVAGAIACGADLVYMGTRFLATAESMAQPEYKQMVVECGPDDLLVSPAITGTAASWLIPSLVANGYDPANMSATTAPQRHYGGGGDDIPKRWRDIWAAGQGLQTIRSIVPTEQVVGQIEDEYRAALERMAAGHQQRPGTALRANGFTAVGADGPRAV